MIFNGAKKTIKKYIDSPLEVRVGKDRWNRHFYIRRLDKCGNVYSVIYIDEREIDSVIDFLKANRNFKHKR